MAVVDNAAGITIDASGQHNNAKLLDGLPAAAATGQAVRFDEAVYRDGSRSFTGAQTGVAGTAQTSLAVRSDVDATCVTIQGVTTGALPTYTITSGTVAAGTAVFTASGNGAFPTLDGNAAITASATEAVSSRFLLSQGASNLDNCVLSLTQQGSGGTPWIAAMYTGLNTSAKTVGSKLRVIAGEQCAGAEYVFLYEGSFTLGTTPLYYHRADARMSGNEGCRWNELCNVNVLSQTAPASSAGTYFLFSGAGVSCTQNNPAGIPGEYQYATGSTATSIGGMGALGPIPITANSEIEIGGTFQIPTLSIAAQEFITNAGVFTSVAGGVILNGFCFVYDRLNKGVNLWAKTVSGGTSTATFTDTGIVVTAGRRYRWKIIRRAGDTAARFYVGSSADTFALVATHSANHPTGVNCGSYCIFYKTAGTSSVNALAVSNFFGDIQLPTRLAA